MNAVATAPRLDVTRGGGITVARIVGCDSLCHENAAELGRALAPLAADSDCQHLVLDLAEVRFLGSLALQAFIRLHRGVRAGGGRLTLIGLNPLVRRVFQVSGLDRLFDLRGAR